MPALRQYENLKAQSIAAMSYIDPAFALLLSAAVLHERLSVPGIIGSVLVSEATGKRKPCQRFSFANTLGVTPYFFLKTDEK